MKSTGFTTKTLIALSAVGVLAIGMSLLNAQAPGGGGSGFGGRGGFGRGGSGARGGGGGGRGGGIGTPVFNTLDADKDGSARRALSLRPGLDYGWFAGTRILAKRRCGDERSAAEGLAGDFSANADDQRLRRIR